MKKIFLLSAKRTPIGSFGGSLSDLSAIDLGVIASKATIEASGIEASEIGEVFFGNVCQANLGQAPARQIAIKSGLSLSTPATTINKVCASGMKSAMLAAMSLQFQEKPILAGGTESMSNIPFYLPDLRKGKKYGHSQVLDGLQKDGLTDVYDQVAMGNFADETAVEFNISRSEQDDFAIESYKRSQNANNLGLFKNELQSVNIPQRKGPDLVIDKDEECFNVSFEKIPSLRPAFSPSGTVTAANASTINDGAAGLLLATEDYVKAHGLVPIAEVLSFADAAQEPQRFTTAPTIAAPLALQKAGLSLKDIDLFEVNEAFSVVALSFMKALDLDPAKVNIHGGAVSLGHPLGASGARIITTLVHAMQLRSAEHGLAAICNGGGGASAMVLKLV